MTLHIYMPQPVSLRSINMLHLVSSEPGQDFKGQATTVRSNVKLWPHHDVTTYMLEPISLQSINFLHLMVSEKQPGQDSF